MRLPALKRHWERLGKHDPYWAVLTDPDKRKGGWDRTEFFASGIREIDAALQRAASLGLVVSRRRALDFGCGVGRLTQALASQFERADGVDISASMLQLAERGNANPDRCYYHRNTAPNLALFDNESFTFIYSALVLQHIAPEYSVAYIRELMRVLAPGGLLVFQLPSHWTAVEPAATALQTPARGPLPDAAYRARLTLEQRPLSVQAGREVTVPVVVENLSNHSWPALSGENGRYRINLGNHWLDSEGRQIRRDDARCRLPHDLPGGGTMVVNLSVTAPTANGTYWLEVDLVQEDVGWFAECGSPAARIRCSVTGGTPEMPVPPLAPSSAGEPRFSERHPQAFALFRATGLRAAYWSWRRGVDVVKSGRDEAVWWLKDHFYKPVVPPLVNWWARGAFAPRMEMHCVLRANVLAIVTESQGEALAIDEETVRGGFVSCRYWILKR